MFLLVMASNVGTLHNVKLIGKIVRREYLTRTLNLEIRTKSF